MISIRQAGPGELDTIRQLFREYQALPGVAACVVSFEQEMAALPGKYAPPGGSLLLAERHGEPLGCVALRPLGEHHAEMKRLYVRAQARGAGVGRMLAERIMAEARQRGYRGIRLDTMPFMTEAIGLYRDLGFREIKKYYDSAPAEALFFEYDFNRG